MKNRFANSFLSLALSCLILISCSSQKDFITDSDYSYLGKFKDYKTFDFARLIETDTLIEELIETTIASKLLSQGYRYKEKNPDLLIVYKLYFEDFEMSGYDQPNIESWVYNGWGEKFENEIAYGHSLLPSNVKAQYDDQKYIMKKGTLLVSFYDRKWNKSVWQGYASGVFDKSSDSAEKNLKIAANRIVREFRLVANGYIAKRGNS